MGGRQRLQGCALNLHACGSCDRTLPLLHGDYVLSCLYVATWSALLSLSKWHSESAYLGLVLGVHVHRSSLATFHIYPKYFAFTDSVLCE